jgi:hypothetical protein
MNILQECLSEIDIVFPDVEICPCPLAEKDHKENPRVFAHTIHIENTICVCRAFSRLPISNQRGIIFHEMGHLYDYANPNSEIRKEIKDPEIRADMICELFFDIRIFYDSNKIQCVLED